MVEKTKKDKHLYFINRNPRKHMSQYWKHCVIESDNCLVSRMETK